MSSFVIPSLRRSDFSKETLCWPWDMSASIVAFHSPETMLFRKNYHSLFRENSEKPLRSSAESHVSPRKVGCFVRGTPKSSVYRWDFPWNKPIGITIPALKINKSLKPPKFGWFVSWKIPIENGWWNGVPPFQETIKCIHHNSNTWPVFSTNWHQLFWGNQRKLRLQ